MYGEDGVADDMLDFLQEFFEAHFELADKPFYVTGESYAVGGVARERMLLHCCATTCDLLAVLRHGAVGWQRQGRQGMHVNLVAGQTCELHDGET